MAKSKTSQFQVRVGGLKLPANVEKRIELEIRQIIMGELARIDLKGDIRFGPARLGPGIRGIIVDIIGGPRGPAATTRTVR